MPDTISLIVPVYNEELGLSSFHERLSHVLTESSTNAEIVYVNDGSSDGSKEVLNRLMADDSRICILDLSRNFGKEVAISAGLDYCQGDAAVIIDADEQDPPELIKEFIHWWQRGYDVVYGQRKDRSGDTWLKRHTSSWFYSVMGRLSKIEIPRDAGDFRLLSRRAIDALGELRETHRYMKGLYAWIGFPQKAVPYNREVRASGESKWTYWRLWNFALEGITSFSDVPLKLATYIGLVTAIAAFGYGIYIILSTLLYGNPIPGYPSLLVVVLFLGGAQLISLGIIGEYLARNYKESKRRKLYFVNEFLRTETGDKGKTIPESAAKKDSTRFTPH